MPETDQGMAQFCQSPCRKLQGNSFTGIATAIAVRTHRMVETFRRNVLNNSWFVLIDVSTALVSPLKLQFSANLVASLSDYLVQF